MTPRIAIPAPTSTDLAYNTQNWAAYADAVRASGGEPLQLPLDLSRRDALVVARDCDAILLPGSPADVDPERYGQALDPAAAPADPAREQLDILLLEHAFESAKPLLAICFGVQILNVWRGGTLIQHLSVLPVNHAAGRAVAVAHTAAVEPHSLLAALTEPSEASTVGGQLRLPINSSHHQAVAIPGAGLKVVARCPQDGVVEALELAEPSSHFLLGVQWHPERTFDSSPTSRAIFARFVQHAADFTTVSEPPAASTVR